MTQFLGFAIPGIPYGLTYAVFAVGLILTYQATGVFNFAFAAQAAISAFVFTLLTVNDGFPVWAAFIVSVVVLAPALGLALDFFLFRRIPNTNTTAKVVTSISMLVGLPALLPVIFGNQNLIGPPSVIFNPNTVYFHLFGLANIPINGIYLATVVLAAGVLIAMVILMRFTPLGLQMRAAVESRRLVQLDGVNATGVVSVAWAISSLLAGLAGVLIAPQFAQFQAQNYVTLMVAAIAAAAWGVLRSMPIATGVAVLIGVVELVLQGYLPTGSLLFSAVLPSLPFIVLVAALLLVPGLRSLDDVKDPMASVDPPTPPISTAYRTPAVNRVFRWAWWALLAAFIVSMLTWIPKTWENVFNSGLALSTIFVSITLITGMGGQLSLAQATLAGIGAFTAGQLAAHLGLNLLVGGLVGAVLAAAVAVLLALASLRLKGLGLALMTLAAALFFDTAVFAQNSVGGGQSGISFTPKEAGLGLLNSDGHAFFVLGMIVLSLTVLMTIQIRKGTIGQYLSAMRGSETAASGIGINLTRQRVLIFALSGAVAGFGGAIFSIQQIVANANQFNYNFSLVFVVIVVTTGVSTVEGAIQAGIGFVATVQLLTYLPGRFGGSSLVFVLFAFGALTYAKHPEGILEYQKRVWFQRLEPLFARKARPPGPPGEPSMIPAAAEGSTVVDVGKAPV